MSKLIPKKRILIIEMLRSTSTEIPVSLTIAERKSVKNVKLSIKPVTIPSGLFFPVATLPESTIGRIGKIHGDRIVTIPARKANASKSIIEDLKEAHLSHHRSTLLLLSLLCPPERMYADR